MDETEYDWGEIESARIQSASGVKMHPTMEQGRAEMKELPADSVVWGEVSGINVPITFILVNPRGDLCCSVSASHTDYV